MSATLLRSVHVPASASTRDRAPFTVRDAKPSDNVGLVALAQACSMSGDIELRMDRAPDFFALNRLEGASWRLAVAEREGGVVGCICFSERECYLDGRVQRTAYIGDLKVHPDHRDSVIADALSRSAAECMGHLPENTPVLITVLAGNAAMERRLAGPRGLARFSHVGTIRTHSLSILWKRRNPVRWAAVSPATWSDVEEMAALWREVASQRQLAPAHDADSLARWVREAPGLDIRDFRLARARDGKLLGFLGLWDQRQFKQLTVVSYSSRMALARRVFNFLAPLTSSEPLPRAGAPLNAVTATHVCVQHDRADVLRALLVSAHNELRGSGCSLLNIGLDISDPLGVALKGLLAQPTYIHAYVTNARGKAWHAELGGTLHYEIALV
ncbi:MAG TPA: GNAT family N-acetyltransferase [Gemmatimonadaceae bacterium]|nr:GNAT family N-acetyltransferase [Gemmatimonadaceae bacterium]